jgi:Skp family chaperone for outer membrane proteins
MRLLKMIKRLALIFLLIFLTSNLQAQEFIATDNFGNSIYIKEINNQTVQDRYQQIRSKNYENID